MKRPNDRPSKLSQRRKQGFLSRSRTPGGAAVLNNRRRKGRKRLTV